MVANKKDIKIILFGSTFIIIFIALVTYLSLKRDAKTKEHNIIVTGLSRGQEGYFQKELASAFQVSSAIQKGKKLLAEGNYDEAIDMFKHAMSIAKMQGEVGMARLYIVDAYEKRRDYKSALEWMTIARDNCPNQWAIKPYIERVKYLEYAMKGEYDFAVEHAKKSVEEYRLIGTAQIEGYTDRLNDLIAAKDYILSLKKK